MSLRTEHDWHEGATLPVTLGTSSRGPAKLATCTHCKTLRVVDGAGASYAQRGKGFLEGEPDCIAPDPRQSRSAVGAW